VCYYRVNILIIRNSLHFIFPYFEDAIQWCGDTNNGFYFPFLARHSIYAIARYMPSPVRPSVCPSVRHTGGSVKDG